MLPMTEEAALIKHKLMVGSRGRCFPMHSPTSLNRVSASMRLHASRFAEMSVMGEIGL